MTDTGAEGNNEAAADLHGSWQKDAGPAGDVGYPDVLVMTVVQPGSGRYVGRKARQEDRFLQWDAGTWHLTDDGRIEISTATDSIDSWPVAVSDGELRIDVAESVLTYRRTTGPDD